MRTNNDGIVPAAIRGANAENSTGSFWTEHYRPEFTRLAPYYGAIPRRIGDILDAQFRAGNIDQVIYSYRTPIAWHDVARNVWVRPDVTYSITTSHHQGKTWRLENVVFIPWDCGIEEYDSYATRRSVYVGNYRNRSVGTVRAGSAA